MKPSCDGTINKDTEGGPVLLITEIFPPRIGGSGRWLWEIYRRFPIDRVVIAAGQAEGQDEFDQAHGLRLVRLPLTLANWGVTSVRGVRGYWRTLRELWPLAGRARVTAMHCGRCVPEGVIARLFKLITGTEYICYIYGEEVNLILPETGKAKVTGSVDDGVLASREIRLLTRWVLHGAKFVVAISRNTCRILEDSWGLPPDRIHLIYPGVDTRRFRPADRDEHLRERLGWGDRPVILTFGRLQRRKGHDQLIRALTTIRRSLPDILYAIVGDGEQRQTLEALVASEGLREHVQFLGRLDEDEMVRCYQQCDLFVLPNRAIGRDIEGFGLVLLEAQACGKPVVAGASGGTAEAMCMPETGLVVPCECAEELASAVVKLLFDPERMRRMGAAARRWSVANFDWDAVGREAGRILGLDVGGPVDNDGCREQAADPIGALGSLS